MDITSACKALAADHTMEDRVLRTDFYDPSARHNSSGDPGGGGGGGGGLLGGPAPGGVGRGSNSAAAARLHG
jgi:hypothetical protein